MEQHQWQSFEKEMLGLYDLYKEAQYALAAAEEFSGTKYVASIVNELRAVLHHLMEAFYEFEQNPNTFDWKKQFIKAKEEHLMRAIFDGYHLCIAMQQKEIREQIEKYSASVISEVFPDYYKELRPYFAGLKTKLAKARTQRGEDSLYSFKEISIQTQEYKVRCDIMVEPLESRKKEKKNAKIRQWTVAIIVGICLVFLREFLTKVNVSENKEQTPNNPTIPIRPDSMQTDTIPPG